MQMFHVRLVDAPRDFILLDPPSDSSPLSNLSDYTCNRGKAHWYFCPTCGVRLFTVIGEGEVVEIDLAEFEGRPAASDATFKQKRKVWRLKKEGYVEGDSGYLSVNASSLDHDQEGLDLRKWHESGWIKYLDEWKDEGERALKPHDGGMY